MTTQLSNTDLNAIQALINNEISRSLGDPCEFEVMYNDLLVCGNYNAEYRSVRGGDCYHGIWEMVSELVSERVTIEGIYDEDGDNLTASTKELQTMFN